MRTIYIKATEMLKQLREEGFNEIGLETLKSEITKRLGGADRTVKQYLEMMFKTGLIKDIGNCHFKINVGETKKEVTQDGFQIV